MSARRHLGSNRRLDSDQGRNCSTPRANPHRLNRSLASPALGNQRPGEGSRAMKMAKATENDLDKAMELAGAFDAITGRWGACMPQALVKGEEEPDAFYRTDDEQCGQVLRYLMGLTECSSLFRVVWGAAVMLDPANKLVDPDADTIEHHPERLAKSTVTITAANADKAQTVMNAGQKAMWAYRDWLRRPSAELRARAERKLELYEKHRRELING